MTRSPDLQALFVTDTRIHHETKQDVLSLMPVTWHRLGFRGLLIAPTIHEALEDYAYWMDQDYGYRIELLENIYKL